MKLVDLDVPRKGNHKNGISVLSFVTCNFLFKQIYQRAIVAEGKYFVKPGSNLQLSSKCR